MTNTNWQYYGGEYTMSYLSQMAGLAVQNFVSAAVGMAVLVAVIRGFTRRRRRRSGTSGRTSTARSSTSSCPLSIVLSVALISQGVPQTFDGAATATTLEGAEQSIARGPVASQIAIKQLGTNGGGFYNSNSAVPFENPNGLTNFLEMLSILLIPAGLVFMFGKLVGARKQGYAVFAAMFAMFVDRRGRAHAARAARLTGAAARPASTSPPATARAAGTWPTRRCASGSPTRPSGRSRPRTPPTARSTAGHDALTAGGGAVPIVNMFTGEVIFGGVGSGLYGMVFYIVIAVFVAGLMVGRTPEYLGKKIEAREVKIAAVGALFVPTMVLIMVAVAVVTDVGLASIYNPGAHGFSEAFYAYDSQGNNNGSAFAGYGATDFSTRFGTVALYLGRFAPLIAALALAGSLAGKKIVPASAGTFRTDGPTFSVLLVAVIVLTAGLMIFPALALGPLVEALS